MKRVFSICLVLILALTTFAFAGCTPKDDNSSKTETPTTQESTTDKKVKIGIIKIVEHASLDTIEQSTIKQLETLGYVNGQNAEITALSAQGDPTNVASMMDSFIANGTDIVVAITTPVASVAINYADQIPVIFSAVSNPVAAGLTTTLEKPDKNVTGTCDAVPVEKILDLALETVTDIKTVGFIYNPGEASSVANIDNAKAYLDSKKIKYVESSVDSSAGIQQAAESLVTKCDVIFTPTDNTVAEGMAVLSQVTVDSKKPCFVGADSMVKDGGLATIGIKYEDLGTETANMVQKVLTGTKVADIPVYVFDDLSTYINKSVATSVGITFSDEILNSDKTVVFE
ncbi:peptide ABC transporter substrate-binding protein [Clostridia bacterium]|nr:peptide ABC transporter substrate-binding protein [Clostridia bacterium]